MSFTLVSQLLYHRSRRSCTTRLVLASRLDVRGDTKLIIFSNIQVFGALLQHSHALAEHAGRSKGLVYADLIAACEGLGVGGSKQLSEEIAERFGDDSIAGELTHQSSS